MYTAPTNTRVYRTLPDAPLKETRTAVATLRSIMLARTSIGTNSAKLGGTDAHSTATDI